MTLTPNPISSCFFVRTPGGGARYYCLADISDFLVSLCNTPGGAAKYYYLADMSHLLV